jgi:hypothetical protein
MHVHASTAFAYRRSRAIFNDAYRLARAASRGGIEVSGGAGIIVNGSKDNDGENRQAKYRRKMSWREKSA